MIARPALRSALLLAVTLVPCMLAAQTRRRHVPLVSAGMAATISTQDFSSTGTQNLTQIIVPRPQLWIDINPTDHFQLEFPIFVATQKAPQVSTSSFISLGAEPHWMFGSYDRPRFYLGGGGSFNYEKLGGTGGNSTSATQWVTQGVAGVEWPLGGSDFRVRTGIFGGHAFANKSKNLDAFNFYGGSLGANCYFDGAPPYDGYSPFNLRVGADYTVEHFGAYGSSSSGTFQSFNLPSFYVGGFVPLNKGEQFQVGGEINFSHQSQGDTKTTSWTWRPMLEYNVFPNYYKKTGLRLQGFGALNHFSFSSLTSVSGTQYGYGAGATLTFPMLGHVGGFGVDYTHLNDNDDLNRPSSSVWRFKFDMTHRLKF